MPTISTTGALEAASKEMISTARFTAEHNAPVWGLVSHFTLKKGEDTGIFPKFGQFTISDLSEGQDMVDEQDLGMSSVSVTTSEVGAKVVLSWKLLRQNVAANFQTAGRQFGDASKRKREADLINLFSGLNGGTTLGAAAAAFSAANATSCVAIAKTDKYGEDLAMIVHPNSAMRLARDTTTVGSGTVRPLPEGYSARLLQNAWTGHAIWGVPIFETGNISRDSSDDMIGAIMGKDALGTLTSQEPFQGKTNDLSLRAWELVYVEDYAAFEFDDTRGAPLTYDAADPATS